MIESVCLRYCCLIGFFYLNMSVVVIAAPVECSPPRERSLNHALINEALRQNVSPELALAIAHTRSLLTLDRGNKAIGIMAIKPQVALIEFGIPEDELFDSRKNIEVGIRYLRALLTHFGRTDTALSHYLKGSLISDQLNGIGVTTNTRHDVAEIMNLAQDYRKSYTVNRLMSEASVNQHSLSYHQTTFGANKPNLAKNVAKPETRLPQETYWSKSFSIDSVELDRKRAKVRHWESYR